MATYKVIQDIEAEDKLVGPLTLRQFVYAGIAAVCLYICFLAYTKGFTIAIGIFFPIAAGCGFFAFPWKGEQPTELWALARIRFALKPRVRIWDQEGAKDIVTITAPKKLKDERYVRPKLSQTEVRSRLKALADTIDSRGWATRNAAYGVYNSTWSKDALNNVGGNSASMAAMIPTDDMFDGQNAVSQKFDQLLAQSQQNQRQRVMQEMSAAQAPATSGPAALPNIPTPAASSAYSVAPLPAPVPVNQPAPNQAQAVQSGMPSLPAIPQAQAAPANANANNYWFANGPAYPTTPATPSPAATGLTPAMPAPTMPTPALHRTPATTNAAALPSLPQIPLPGSGRIESDAPVVISATPTADDTALSQSIKQQNEQAVSISYGHMRVLQPGGQQTAAATATSIDPYQTSSGQTEPGQHDQYVNGAAPTVVPAEPVTPPPNPAILNLANNDDLDIATIARQANRELSKTPDEVEIKLR